MMLSHYMHRLWSLQKEKSVKDKINFCIVSCKYIKKSYILILKAEYDIYVQTYLATFILDVDKQRFPYLVSLILRDSQYETFLQKKSFFIYFSNRAGKIKLKSIQKWSLLH